MTPGRWLAFLAAGFLSVVGTIAAFAPAGIGDWALDRATNGRLRLADATGSIWNGQGTLVLAEPAEGADATVRRSTVSGVVVPGRLSWQVRGLPLLVGLLDATISMESMSQPLRLSGSFGELRGTASSLDLPALDLGKLGSPWNTIRPTAALAVRWEGFTIRQGLFDGKLAIELRDAASAMTPVRPLGSYRVDVTGTGSRAELSIATLSGPLRLAGKGVWDQKGGLRFTAEAEPEEAERARLQSFLALIGRREGEKTVIKIGA